ncbi:MFS transporter [Actinokineospora sp. 24-640]
MTPGWVSSTESLGPAARKFTFFVELPYGSRRHDRLMTRPVRMVRDRVTLVCYAQFALCMYFLFSFGLTVPLMSDELGLSRTVASLHGSAVAIGAIVSGVAVPRLVRRFGRVRMSFLASAALSGAAGVLCFASNLAGTLPATALAATAGTAVAACAIAGLSSHHGQAAPAAITEASAVGSGIALLAPLVLGAGVAIGAGWRAGTAVTIVLAAAIAVVARGTAEPPRSLEAAPAPSGCGRLPGRYWLAWAVLLLCLSVETCLAMWMTDELRADAAMSTSAATASASALMGGVFFGRLAGSRLTLRHDARSMLLWALALAAAGFTVFWTPATPWLSVTGLWLTGIGIALHHPLALALAIRASAGQSDLAAARTLYAEALAYSAAPLILAMGADRFGPHYAFLLVPALLALAAIGVARLRAP